MEKAAGLKRRMRLGIEAINLELARESYPIDVAYALCELLEREGDVDSDDRYESLHKSYELISHLVIDDGVGERHRLLAKLSFLAWDHSRKFADYAQMHFWQERCSSHVKAQDDIRTFLAIPFSQRSSNLNGKFLADETVVITFCDLFERERNAKPAVVASEGAQLYAWLTDEGVSRGLRQELVEYCSASLALSVLSARFHLRDKASLDGWSRRVQEHVERCEGGEPLAAVLEHVRIGRLYWDQSYVEAAVACELLVNRMTALGMNANVLKTRFLFGAVLKELGDFERALDSFSVAHAGSIEINDLMTASLALASCAEISARRGCFEQALGLARDALATACRSNSNWPIGQAQVTFGEILRDHGDFQAAAEAYGSGARSFDAAGMEGIAAYMRMLLAEVLLLAGRPEEATIEIVRALPAIEKRRLSQEGLVAVRLLRVATRRQQTDALALRRLKEQLQLMNREGRL